MKTIIPHALLTSLVLALLMMSPVVAQGNAPADESTPELLIDLRQGVAPDSSYPFSSAFYRTPSYPATSDPFTFWADDGVYGRELWTTDGTPEGLRRLTDVCPGPCSSLTFRDQVVYWQGADGASWLVVADDGVTGTQVWRVVEATGEQTRLTFLCPEVERSCDTQILLSQAELDDGSLLFSVQTSGSTDGVWATDGTPDGTRRLWERDEFEPEVRSPVFRLGEHLVFAARTAALGTEWYRADGSGSLPVLVQDVCVGSCHGVAEPAQRVGDRLIFSWWDSEAMALRVWATGGTEASTESLGPGCGGYCPTPQAVIGEMGYFLDETHLWATDGTFDGTRQLVELPEPQRPPWAQMAPIGDDLAVLLRDDQEFVLWRLDDPLGLSPAFREIGPAGRVGEQLLSTGDRLVVLSGYPDSADLWLSDGNTSPTPVDIDGPPSPSDEYAHGTVAGDQIFFTAASRQAGVELWRSDGTFPGTRLAHDLAGFPAGSKPRDFTAHGERVLFTVDTGANDSRSTPQTPRELWITDGSFGGTQRLFSPIEQPDHFGRGVRDLQPAGDRALFVVDGDLGREPWITDGTLGGTRSLGDLNPGPAESHAREATQLGGKIYFLAERGSGEKIWTTDGTPGGTQVVVDVFPDWENDFYGSSLFGARIPPSPIFPRNLTVLGDRLIFTAMTPEHGAEVWRSDGTAAGTALLKDLAPGPEWSEPSNFVRVGAYVVFLAEGEDQVDVWRTDGTTDGTLRLATLDAIWFDYVHYRDERFRLEGFQDGERVAISYENEGHAPRLWVVALGAPATPVELGLLAPARELTALREHVYFAGGDAEEGSELWRTDGTAEGTERIVLRPGPRGSGPRQLTALADSLLFAADDGELGHEIWRLDVDDAGVPIGAPHPAFDLRPGAGSSSPDEFHLHGSDLGQQLFLAADDGEHGREPWVVDLGPDVCVPDGTTVCLGDRFRLRADYRERAGAPLLPAQSAGLQGDTGYFTFFGDANLELAVKVLDGTPINDAHWLFYGALSDVEYRLLAEDLHSGVRRTFVNAPGNLCGDADIDAFPAPPSSPMGAPSRNSPTKDGAESLRLHDRFEVTVDWRVERGGNIATGRGTALPYSSDSGAFWFFGPNNVELVVKILDGRPINDRWWLFYGALSDVEYTIRVVDTETGDEKTYRNPAGTLCGDADVELF